ncbi:hypothetical protein D5086_023943 [Populus alba]|uniref:Uncharacterized protein n=2 Tax=Populus TaxID=3689 RepID=A0ACC4B4C6_POPAL|nr:hypothetical protein NC653_030063 [Populus alba x Populus x berolinensis]KAJ6974036.1 hypothetical protein NC653_030176 [Populus alba x Populus x berolinensis]KAJ6974041.1 hypothetical protein NC653_030181 [Populus alba x Populus x berolinensis]KAJ6974055.1 hypothetical protein NC653_030194 [Populus alba x Populus x berolinensis]
MIGINCNRSGDQLQFPEWKTLCFPPGVLLTSAYNLIRSLDPKIWESVNFQWKVAVSEPTAINTTVAFFQVELISSQLVLRSVANAVTFIHTTSIFYLFLCPNRPDFTCLMQVYLS